MTNGRPIRASRAFRGCLVVALLVVPLAPEMLSGCGSSGAAPASGTPDAAVTPAPTTTTAPTSTGDGSVSYVMVTTGGGGSGQSSSSSGGDIPFKPIGDDASQGDDSGMVAETGTPDSSDSDTGIQDSGNDSGPPQCGAAYTPPVCGDSPCDLRSNTCCLTVSIDPVTFKLTLGGRCVPGAGATCNPSKEQTVHCLQACECGGGLSCCGVWNSLQPSVQTVCQAVSDGGYCQPHTTDPNPAVTAAQFCKTNEECKNGQGCIPQTCAHSSKFTLCGVQSQDPFLCTAD